MRRSRLCLSQSDVVLLIAAAGDDPSVGAVEARALATGSLRCELALLHEADPGQAAQRPAMATWLADRPVADRRAHRGPAAAFLLRLRQPDPGRGGHPRKRAAVGRGTREPGLSGWRVLGRRLNPFTPARPVPGIAEILSRSTGLSQVRHRRTALGDDRVDLLLRPPVARLRGLDFKGGIALIEAGYRYAAEELSKSGLAKQFMT
jgi:hypothetical protein